MAQVPVQGRAGRMLALPESSEGCLLLAVQRPALLPCTPPSSPAHASRLPSSPPPHRHDCAACFAHAGEGTVYEKILRATFGNNPDTSKALRM